MITYKFNDEKQILETVFSGMIEPEEIFNYMDEVNNNSHDLPRDLDVIIDVRTADFDFEPIAMQNIVRANFRMNKEFHMIKNAILANDPHDVTLVMFQHYTLGSDKYHVNIFTDREIAEKWLRSW